MRPIAQAIVCVALGVLMAGCGEPSEGGKNVQDEIEPTRAPRTMDPPDLELDVGGLTIEAGGVTPELRDLEQANDETLPVETISEEAGPPVIEVLKPEAIRKLIDDARGTVVVANFWATWCPPCVEETPELIEFYEKFHGKTITFLSLCVDDPSTVEKAVRPYVAKHAIPFPIYVVDERNPEVISEVLELEMNGALPTTWVIDSKGMPVRSWVEEVTAAELWEVAEPLLTQAFSIPGMFRGQPRGRRRF